MSKKRIDLGGDGRPLTDNPFASLSKTKDELPQEAEARIERAPVKAAKAAFSIGRTRKGGMPITVERRPGGKSATLIRNVTGDAGALLSMLKKRCGTGGVVREDCVEIQGDQLARLEGLLKEYLD